MVLPKRNRWCQPNKRLTNTIYSVKKIEPLFKEKKMKRGVIYGLAISAIAIMAFSAKAENYTIQGVVTAVEPVYRTKVVTEPVQKCWTEEVPVYGQGPSTDTTGDMLTGAIIGGIIGNNIKGEDGGGAAGALLGGLLGHGAGKNKQGQTITGYREVNKCATTYNDRTEEYLAGYKISYEALGLKGTVSRTRSISVGSNITVNVNITAY